MSRRGRWLCANIVPLLLVLGVRAQPPTAPPVPAVVETSLATAGKYIRQFAFDNNPDSYFLSAQAPGGADHFTLSFNSPVLVNSIAVTTGSPEGKNALDAGTLDISSDGKTFTVLAKFAEGAARADALGRKIKAVRIQPQAGMAHGLAIREIAIMSEPRVAFFHYPVELLVDTSEAPEMKAWAENAARVCERHYAMICEELKSEGFKPRSVVRLVFRKDYRGVAEAGGGRITGSVKYFKDHPQDVGALVHETVHCVQDYRTGNNPGWLVEGIADYIRFFKYEPGKLGRLDSNARFNGSYRTTAAFLAFVSMQYDPNLVRKLNKMMREGEYREDVSRALTKKSVQELDVEWRATRER